jgi:hypothetical protein
MINVHYRMMLVAAMAVSALAGTMATAQELVEPMITDIQYLDGQIIITHDAFQPITIWRKTENGDWVIVADRVTTPSCIVPMSNELVQLRLTLQGQTASMFTDGSSGAPFEDDEMSYAGPGTSDPMTSVEPSGTNSSGGSTTDTPSGSTTTGNNHATATPQPGTAVVFWQSTSGSTAFWQVNTSGVRRGSGNIYAVSVPSGWTMRAMGDINADGRPELFWQATDGATATWFLDTDYIRRRSVTTHNVSVPSDWTLRAAGDGNGDGRVELFWQATSGATATWFLDTNGVRTVSRSMHNVSVPTDWTLRGAND